MNPTKPVKSLLEPPRRCRFLRIRAVLLLALGRPHAALSCFEQILQRQPLDLPALASRAHVQAELNNYQEAVLSLRVLTQAAPQAAAGWFNLGFALHELAQHPEAASAFRRALVLDPRLDRAWYGLGLVLMELRQLEAAVVALEKTTGLQPMSPHGWFRLAQVRQALGQRDQVLKIIQHLRGFEPSVAAQLERVLEITGRGNPPSACAVAPEQAAATGAACHAA